MCQIVLRGLLLPDNKYQTNASGNTTLKNLALNNATEVEEAPQRASTLTKLDSLRLSGASEGSSKGSIPINLVSPDSMTTESVKPKRAGGSKLAALTMLGSGKPTPKMNAAAPPKNTNKPTLYSLADLNVSASSASVSAYTQTAPANNKKPATGVSLTNMNFIDATDKTSDKLGAAIEKIQIWDRKIGALNTELKKQDEMKQNSGSIDPARLMTRTKQVKEARTSAVLARDEAVKAYTAAINEITSQFGSTGIASTSAKQYKTSYDMMEKLFSATDAKDKTTMSKVLDFMRGSMTRENFNLAVSYFNPWNDNPSP